MLLFSSVLRSAGEKNSCRRAAVGQGVVLGPRTRAMAELVRLSAIRPGSVASLDEKATAAAEGWCLDQRQCACRLKPRAVRPLEETASSLPTSRAGEE